MPPQRVDAVNFIRAESDRYFDDLVARSGGVNRWRHAREPAPIDKQAVVRMNRDTLYSDAILDVSQGATISMPDAAGRYQTAMVVDEDHYIDHVFDSPGEHRLEASMFRRRMSRWSSEPWSIPLTRRTSPRLSHCRTSCESMREARMRRRTRRGTQTVSTVRVRCS